MVTETYYDIVTSKGRQFRVTVGEVLPQLRDGERVISTQRHLQGELGAAEKSWLLTYITPYTSWWQR